MKNRLAALGILGLATTFAMVACSGDDDAGSPGPQTAGAGGSGGGGNSSGGTTSGGMSTAGSPGAGTSGGGSGGGGSGGTMSVGGEAGAGGAPIEGGESGMGGAVLGGAGGAGGDGGAGGAVDEVVTLTPTTCNYTEVESNSSQDTGLDAKAALKVICGKVDTGHFSAGDHLLDKDTYGIALTGGKHGLMRLELPTFTGLTRIEVTIDQETVVITQPVTVFNIYSLFSSVFLRISAYSAADLSESIPYQLSVVSDDVATRCTANNDAASFTEAGDGANNRGNDVYMFDSDVPSTTGGSDSAEATGITLAQASYRVNGVSADVPRLGDFLDGDSYTFHTGPSTTQLTLRADWQGGRNMDLFVMKAATLERAGYSTTFSNTSPEYVTVRVKPNTDYIAFAGGFSGSPFDYSLTLCGETYSFNGP